MIGTAWRSWSGCSASDLSTGEKTTAGKVDQRREKPARATQVNSLDTAVLAPAVTCTCAFGCQQPWPLTLGPSDNGFSMEAEHFSDHASDTRGSRQPAGGFVGPLERATTRHPGATKEWAQKNPRHTIPVALLVC